MQKILIPVDGSDCSLRAVAFAIALAENGKKPVKLHVLNVQTPVTFGHIKKFVKRKALEDYYHSQGQDAMRAAKALLEKHAVEFTTHARIGPAAENIVDFALAKGCDHIVLGNRGLGALSALLLGSVAAKVASLSPVPVTLVK